MPGLIKIGQSGRDPETYRKEKLDTTSVPEPFIVEYYAFVENHNNLEKQVHNKLYAQRVHRQDKKQREFFTTPISEAINTIRELAGDSIRYEKNNYTSPEEIEFEEYYKELDKQKRREQIIKEREKASLEERRKLREKASLEERRKHDEQQRLKKLEKIESKISNCTSIMSLAKFIFFLCILPGIFLFISFFDSHSPIPLKAHVLVWVLLVTSFCFVFLYSNKISELSYKKILLNSETKKEQAQDLNQHEEEQKEKADHDK